MSAKKLFLIRSPFSPFSPIDTDFRYKLDTTSRKYLCPSCGKRTFVRYIDTHTGQLLPERYGRCDRESNCAYHFNPYKDNFVKDDIRTMVPMGKPVHKFIPAEILRQTLTGYETNNFIQNLLFNVPFPFQTEDIEKVIALYFLGSIISGQRAGAITFPFIDINGKICAIQVKEFDLMNHTTGTDFLHSIIERSYRNEPLPDWLKAYLENDKKITCLFGDHLLKKYLQNPIALVEAPKTAIYGTLYFGFPDDPGNYLWLAVYNLSSLTFEKCQVLKGRKVILFPDLSKDGKAFELWSRKCKELSERLPGTFFKISDLLEKYASASERLNGLDIGDFLIKQDWREFRSQPVKGEKGEKSESPNNKYFTPEDHSKEGYSIPIPVKNINVQKIISTDKLDEPGFIQKREDWINEIEELEQFFKVTPLPSGPVQLNHCTKIIDISKFIDCELSICKGQNGNRRYKPYLERLQELKRILMANLN